MKSVNWKHKALFALILVCVITIVACSGGETGTGNKDQVLAGGDSSGGGSGDTPADKKASIGVLTAFGSIFVNGTRFNTDNSEIYINGQLASESELTQGMVVTVVGTVDHDSASGVADKVIYDNEIVGVVLANNYPDSLNVMGQIIYFDEQTVVGSEIGNVYSVEDITTQSVVEVSGYNTGNGRFYATLIKVKRSEFTSSDEMEVTGIVTLIDGEKFNIGDLQVYYDSVEILPGGVLQAGTEVKVTGKYVETDATGPMLFKATQIELVESDVAVGNMVELEGVVTRALLDGFFNVNGNKVVVSEDSTTFADGDKTDLIDGARVKVRGTVGELGELYADRVEIEQPPELAFSGRVDGIDIVNNSVTMFGQTIVINNDTILKDDRDVAPVQKFALLDLVTGDYLDVKFRRDGSTFVATKLEREDVEDTAKLKGTVDIVNGNANELLLQVAGVSMLIDNPRAGVWRDIVAGTLIEAKGIYSTSSMQFEVVEFSLN